MIEDQNNPIYIQERVGRHNVTFKLFKFRTMSIKSKTAIPLTIGNKDGRITSVGYYLRKYKLDELPQLFNILFGDMAVVGPRPEVSYFTKFYTSEQMKVLNMRPGLTDYASIKFRNENEILAQSESPLETYISEIMPDKLRLNLIYIYKHNLWMDVKIIICTIIAIIKIK